MIGLFTANTINVGADLGAVAAAINLLVPAVPIAPLVLPIALGILALQIRGSYRLIARTFKWLTLARAARIRNGRIHILDYKPHAVRDKPITQLMIYALALSRRTGLRLYDFVCAWFDERNYFEFYPLHVVHKRRR